MVKNEALVTVTGWLNDVKDFQWGRAIKVGVDVRKKNDQDEWETVDKTIYDVTTDSQVALDGVKQVVVVGRIVGTSTFAKRDGSTGSAIRVRAESVTPAANQVASGKIDAAAINEVWPTVIPGAGKPVEDAPF
jgi:hypothetical protein